MKLKDLLKDIYSFEIEEHFQLYDIHGISCDSRDAQEGGIFVAIRGSGVDGADFIDEAISKGAVAVAIDQNEVINSFNKNVCILKVENTRKFLAEAAGQIYNFPWEQINCFGITGTNGKTTISYLIESILKSAQRKCGVIGTINCHYSGQVIPINNTTPSIVDICHYLTDMKIRNVRDCIMEVSSHALDQDRVLGIDFKTAIFTNLTQDHLDYHQSMESYFLAKSKLFSTLSKDSCAVINTDDVWGQKMIERTQAKVITYGIDRQADIMASDISLALNGSRFILKTNDVHSEFETTLIGRHNIYNILAAVAACLNYGVSFEDIQSGIEYLNFISGRLEPIIEDQNFFIFVDYAHTDDALKNVLQTLQDVKTGKLIVVFGCGGDRDKTKRIKMGAVASALSDFAIITNDNPRSENPQEIAHKISSGFDHDRYLMILDRREAIKKAFSMAEKNDIVLIAGKGHENYQILKHETIHFDDRQAARECLA